MDDVEWLESKLLFDRVPVQDRYVRFFVLVTLSTIIAAYGVTRDSSATVIGAMIVAPLMTPIMAISLSTITGDSRNIARSFLIVAAGAALVMGLSYLLALLLPGELVVTENAQVMSRTAPRDIDLIIALAAGAAGAFVTSRADVPDALPGVAIAVSLLPPLSVSGITLAAGEIALAWDAFMLFLTNFLAITAAGLAIFALMGYGSAELSSANHKSRVWITVAIVTATLIIMVPLSYAGYTATLSGNMRRDTKKIAEEWLAGTGYGIDMVEADEGEIDVVITGDGELPEFDDLLSELEESYPDVTVRLKVIPEQNFAGKTGSP